VIVPLSEEQMLDLLQTLERRVPLVTPPYGNLAEQIGAQHNQVWQLMQQLQEQGLFRRVGLVLNHRALGFVANAMLVLDVPDALGDEVGNRLGHAPGVNLCYQRPRRLPQWRYNLFCMVHGRERKEVQAHIQRVLEQQQLSDLPHQLLFSTRAFQTCGERVKPPSS
ncbi:AsnC family protein, partial [Pseudomonas paraveronii]|uniref:siroheme decarboxylase subunit beta n=1 Tax=Pseudomonas paraveronii TaxID=3040598 RepID=UPI003CC64F4F